VALVGLLFAQQCSIEAFFGNVYTEDVLFHHLAPSLAGAHLLPDSLVN
jgi:hypothetical protein